MWLKFLLIFGVCTLLSVISAGQTYINRTATSGKWGLIYSLTDWYSWAALTPLIIRLIDRYPLEQRRWRQRVFIHLPAGFIFSLLQLTIQAFVWQWIAPAPYRAPSIEEMLFNNLSRKLHISLLTYWAIVGAGHAVRYYRSYRDEELQRSQLTEQLTRAQLDALKMQLQPHFLFNTLNTVAALIRRDPRKAELMISRLADLLRLTLENDASKEVTLKQELEFLEKYLEIELTRFHDRLVIERRIDQQTLDALIPHMILQPIVENALRHGIAKRAGAGLIRITSERVNGSLRLGVHDDGYGVESDQAGVGLANTRARLARLYGADQSFKISNAPDGGTEVCIVIPFHS